jgi:hypothetical protein
MRPGWLVVLLAGLLPAPSVAADGQRLETAAQASPGATACGVPQGATSAWWDQTTNPRRRVLCRTLARGYAALRTEPARALLAARGSSDLASTAEAALLEARALVALANWAEAWRAFARARPHEIAAPEALHDYAVAAAMTGHAVERDRAYRLLVSRANLLDNGVRRQRAYLEAALWTMQSGPGALNDAVAYLNEARRVSAAPGLEHHVTAALALALDRQGHAAESQALLADGISVSVIERTFEGPSVRSSVAAKRAFDRAAPVLPPLERYALTAIALERQDRLAASEQWDELLSRSETMNEAWVQHARTKRDTLSARRNR